VPAVAVAGDFASTNPRHNALAGPGGFVAGPSGLYVGRFAWISNANQDPDNYGTILNNFGSGLPLGFMHRASQALITDYLGLATQRIPQGFGANECFDAGDFWVQNDGTTPVLPYMKVYAFFSTGQASAALTGAASSVALASASIAPATALSATGSISGNTLTLTAVAAGTAVNGTIITGAGVATGSQIVSQLIPLASGEALGGVGRYSLNIGGQSVASEAIAGTSGILTLNTATPQPVSGSLISGTGVTAGTTVWGQIDALDWVVSPSQTAGATTITSTTNIETKWIAESGAAPGELFKMTSQAPG